MKYIKMKNIKFIIFIKISTFILLTWLYSFITDVLFTKSLQNNNELNVTYITRPFRLLTKSEILNETENYGLREKLSEDVKEKNYKKVKKNTTIYGQLKRQGLNELDIYKKSFACKYSKKMWFTKLDCYCEKKIFDKLDGIYLLFENMKDDKKGFKKKISKRYGLFVGLSVIFVVTIEIFNVVHRFRRKCLFCGEKEDKSHVQCDILLYILPIIIFLLFAYIAIKIIKYDRLVLGKVEGKKIAKKISCYYDDAFNST